MILQTSGAVKVGMVVERGSLRAQSFDCIVVQHLPAGIARVRCRPPSPQTSLAPVLILSAQRARSTFNGEPSDANSLALLVFP